MFDALKSIKLKIWKRSLMNGIIFGNKKEKPGSPIPLTNLENVYHIIIEQFSIIITHLLHFTKGICFPPTQRPQSIVNSWPTILTIHFLFTGSNCEWKLTSTWLNSNVDSSAVGSAEDVNSLAQVLTAVARFRFNYCQSRTLSTSYQSITDH